MEVMNCGCPKEFPSFRLDAVTHRNVAMVSELFSLQQVEEYLFVRIPPHIAHEYELYEVAEIKEKAIPLEDPDSDSDSDSEDTVDIDSDSDSDSDTDSDSDSDSEDDPKYPWEHDKGRIWYKFKSELLDMETGYHQYRMSFKNSVTGDTCLLYFAYRIQNNYTDKPYYYMENARKYLENKL